TIDQEHERASGLRAGRAWAEESADDRDAIDQVEAIDLEEAGFNGALAVYMRCIDPEGNLAMDDIFDGFEADGRALTSDYLFGFIEGARSMVAGAERPPN